MRIAAGVGGNAETRSLVGNRQKPLVRGAPRKGSTGLLSVRGRPRGWTRTEPAIKTTDEDKFGFGTISLVDYAAIDGAGKQVGQYSQDTVIAIAPSQPLHGELFERDQPMAIDGPLRGDHLHTGQVSAMRLLPSHQIRAKLAASASAAAPVIRYYRSTLKCYDDSAESPYVRIGDPARGQITFTPGFRDVFGNRFDAASAPAMRRRLFYTDALASPSEWPGIRFAAYPGQQGGKPYLFLEMQYRFLDQGQDKKPRKQRLKEVRAQLQGVNGDVAVAFSADPIIASPVSLSYDKLATIIKTWIDNEDANNAPNPDPLVEPLAAIACNGQVNDLVKFEPRLTITRTKADYGPSSTDLPKESGLAQTILSQATSASSPVTLQAASSRPTSIHQLTAAATTRSNDEFRIVAKAFQDNLAATMKMQVGFLRDRLNQHKLWFVPNAFFPSAPNAAAYAGWSFATARPLSTKPGSETFSVPDFKNSCTTTGPDCWQKHPIVTQTAIDQDFDELGRVAFRLIEEESADLGVMTAKANADAARKLLSEREQIALTLTSFQGDGGPGYLVPLYANTKPDDLEPASVVRIAKDAFLSNLNAFYNVDTIIQLPLTTPGSNKILTFEGSVTSTFVAGPTAPQPVVSNILLGGGDKKVTLLYDLPAGTTLADSVQRLGVITGSIHHIQLPLPDAPTSRSNVFNQGSWLELVDPQQPQLQLQWKAPPQFIPVADRRFPFKPVINSTEVLMPWMDPDTRVVKPKQITAANASLLVRWGWKFQFGLIDPGTNDVVHVTARYNGSRQSTTRLSALAATTEWRPQSLLNSLFAIKLLRDNLQHVSEPDRLQITAALAEFLREALSPRMSIMSALSATPPEDHFTIPAPKAGDPPTTHPGPDAGGVAIMKGAIDVSWSSAQGQKLAKVIALPDATGNNAFLTGANPVRSYRVTLKLLRNEKFGPGPDQPANPSLVYECAPVESPLECWAQNIWPPLTFDKGGQPLQAALRNLFEGLFQQANLSSMNLEVGASLVWQNGKLTGATPFSILPKDMKPAGGTADDVADFVFGKYQDLLGTGVPADVSPVLRLRVKLATRDPDPASRTVLDITAIDFPL